MNSSKPQVELKDLLTEYRNTIHSGKSALEEDLLNSTYGQFNNIISQIVNAKLLTDKEVIKNLIEIFNSSIPANLAYGMMNSVDAEIYFELGNYILDELEKGKGEEQNQIKSFAHQYLNLFRLPEFLVKIYDDKKWEELIFKIILKSKFRFYELYKQRLETYPDKTLFNVLHGKTVTQYTWNQSGEFIESYKKSIIGLAGGFDQENFKIAFLMENSLTMAFMDLACLTGGVANVMIPANSVPQHIEFILNQTEAPVIFVSKEKQLSKLKSVKNNLLYLKLAVLMEGSSAEDWVITLQQFLEYQSKYSQQTADKFINSTTMDSLATIMYTSGTTGEPKGIMFTNMNIVYKRFCRAMALPKIGDKDRFLSYLPLFHTFGRWFEMTGSLFWAATYSFMENPSLETMLSNLEMVKPTIFISIPKKWIQLYEFIGNKVNIELDDEEIIKNTVEETTGDHLKWGLSAAGYLPAEIFQFFQKYGIELMSGFGMTEATGGITMTPPGKYIPDSLGKALPGIDIKLAEDGELLIKGPYVMKGYFGLDNPFDKDGWFPTGDIMTMDKNGFIEIVDRKKEIYKNIKGETIAPQKIENYFRDFENVKQVFLAGDHRPFNTVLIYPNLEEKNSILTQMNEAELKDYFASVIVSVNKFLAPFERIVDFRIINRPFSMEKGELTPKGTYKRRAIEKNFRNLLDEMYAKDHTSVYIENTEIRLPNWFLREKGCLSGDIVAQPDGISIPKLNSKLRFKVLSSKNNRLKIGDYTYSISTNFVELQDILTNPLYWCGNENLFEFAGEAIVQWHRQNSKEEKISLLTVDQVKVVNEKYIQRFEKIFNGDEISLIGFHYAVYFLRTDNDKLNGKALDYFKFLLNDETLPIYRTALYFASKPFLTGNINVRRKLFKYAIPKIKIDKFYELLRLYLNENYNFLDEDLITTIIEGSKGKENLQEIEEILINEIRRYSKKSISETPIPAIFNLLTKYGIRHPTRYGDVRRMFARFEISKEYPELVNLAENARYNLRKGFREWLGPNEQVAVDVETGEEYQWKDVVIFEENIDGEIKKRILDAIINTTILRETVFLFSKGVLLHLDSILPGGIWISLYEETGLRYVFRITIQTRMLGSFEMILKLNKSMNEEDIKQKIKWLIIAGTKYYINELVEDFGCYIKEYDLWTQKYVPGDTVEKLIRRELKRDKVNSKSKLYHLWPNFVWNAAAAYFNFWKLTDKSLILKNPTIENFVVPFHDYQTGTRIVSLTEKREFQNLTDLFGTFYMKFIKESETKYDFLHRDSIWNYIFSGLINARGEQKGINLLKQFENELLENSVPPELDNVLEKLQLFLKTLNKAGYIPKQLYFAIKRFHRWFKLNNEASIEAQAEMINELYDTYNISELENNYPEARTRFFLETCFGDSKPELKSVLWELVKEQHKGKMQPEEILAAISKIQTEFDLTEKEAYFLTRLSYPHLKPNDSAELVKIKGTGSQAANLVVQLEDYDGNPYIIRGPITPKEISKLHNLFLEANLQVHFRPEHQFLVALSERGFIFGGLFYVQVNETTVHMEKIVVADAYRRLGISDGLMNEFFNRLIDRKIEYVTTGFFRPEYFYRFGFKIEKKYSGLVKKL